jgi:hypothetical protein
MKLLMERFRRYLNEGIKSPITGEVFEMPPEIYEGTGNDEEAAILVKNIPMNLITMLRSQGEAALRDIRRGEPSMTEGLPLLWYDLDKEQLIIDDGNHRIFQKWLAGEDTFDALVYSSDWHGQLRSVYEGEEIFDWGEDYRQ